VSFPTSPDSSGIAAFVAWLLMGGIWQQQ